MVNAAALIQTADFEDFYARMRGNPPLYASSARSQQFQEFFPRDLRLLEDILSVPTWQVARVHRHRRPTARVVLVDQVVMAPDDALRHE
jgi:hypothetical protein